MQALSERRVSSFRFCPGRIPLGVQRSDLFAREERAEKLSELLGVLLVLLRVKQVAVDGT